MTTALSATPPTFPERIGTRYLVSELLGRGGMAHVYRVTDVHTGREMALKQVLRPRDSAVRPDVAALFEREFQTLAQLSHPHVIEVYDYGLDEAGPYYTMELLDGGDLRDHSPIPWRKACALIFEVCSSLALLHSRSLIHRDVSPRNVRCTRDGQAKLIDFGAMAPVGAGGQVVGTPAFVAPEVVQRSNLDARTDVFSLGATLYYALTRRMPYQAREFSELTAAWAIKPAPPSAFAADIPPELDALVASMLGVEPALRPRSAFDVMQRLAAIGGLDHDEPLGVAQAYLARPVMVGRERMFALLRRRMTRALRGRGRSMLIEGQSGLGRSRMLDACMLESRTLGAAVLRAGANAGGSVAFGAAQALGEQLLLALPELAWSSAEDEGVTATLLRGAPPGTLSLRRLTGPTTPSLDTQIALGRWLLRVSEQHPLAIAVDDAQGLDEPSAALLATLADHARGRRLLLVLTLESGAARASSPALSALRARCVRWQLSALDRTHTEQLLASVFGDVPNIGLLSHSIHAVAAGNPRDALDVAQHLVDRGVIQYEQGAWTLPAQLDASDLPRSAEDAIHARVSAFGPLARSLTEFHALALHDGFTRADYARLRPGARAAAIDAALTHLLAHGALTGDGGAYTLAHGGWARAVLAQLPAADLPQRHRSLAAFHRDSAGLQAAHHLLAGGELEAGVELIGRLLEGIRDQQALALAAQTEPAQLAPMFERALAAAITLRRPAREAHELRRWLCSLSIVSDSDHFIAVAPALLAQLDFDCGLDLWRAQDPGTDPNTRLMTALAGAQARFNATAEADRVYPVDQAIRNLVQYVSLAIVIATWSLDGRMLRSLPALLEPFASLSCAIEAVWLNAVSSVQSLCNAQPSKARANWSYVFDKLGTISSAELPYVNVIRSAVACAIGTLEARIGLPTASHWIEFLAADPLQRLNGLYLQRAVHLQQGDWDEAERLRRQAELLGLQSGSRQMFNLAPLLELAAHSFAGNLGGLKQTAARIEVHAQRHAGWAPYRELAEALFQRQRGDLEAACAAFVRGLALAAPDENDPNRQLLAWPTTVSGYMETLILLGRAAEARAHGERALAICRERGFDLSLTAFDIVRALALAEAKLGEHAPAVARLEGLIAEHVALGITGLHLGASYETRARIAIWMLDREAFTHFARLAAREYHHAEGSPLGVRYERLLEEARRSGMQDTLESANARNSALPRSAERLRTEQTLTLETQAMRDASGALQRAARALKLLCDTYGAEAGHLLVVAKHGLVRAASRGERELPLGLSEYLANYLANDTQDACGATTTGSSQSRSASDSHWTSPDGRAYYPVVLACLVDGVERYAGLAALVVSGAREHRPGQAQVARQVGSLLIDAGDAAGLPIDQVHTLGDAR